MKSLIEKNIGFKAYSRADKIIRYLTTPEDETIDLTDTEKTTLDRCKAIHGYRLRFTQKEHIIELICKSYGIKERQAYNLLNETEKIFGTVHKVAKDYERQFLLNASLKNIEIAMAGRNSKLITNALLAHYKFAGLDEFIPDMPDFSKLEQHKYLISLPPGTVEMLVNISRQGAVKLTDILPAPSTSGIEEAKEVNE
jgi:hypothetical protein